MCETSVFVVLIGAGDIETLNISSRSLSLNIDKTCVWSQSNKALTMTRYGEEGVMKIDTLPPQIGLGN